MAIKTSYSQNSTYKQCPKFWSWKYEYGFEPEGEGASLYFGSAVDDAVTAMLEGKTNYQVIFSDKWFSSFRNKQPYPIFDNLDINFSYNDFDPLVFTQEDLDNMTNWITRLKLLYTDPVKAYREIVKIKKNPYKEIKEAELRYFNRASWLSLKRKGEMLIEAFRTEIFPKIKYVHSTQRWGKIEDGVTSDKITGKLDMVLDYEGYDKPIIFDLKTAARPYTEAQIELTEQLTLYSAMVGKEYDTDLVGYIVLVKALGRDTDEFCSECNYTKDSRHRTCNNIINGERCGGKWEKRVKLRPQIQVMVKEKTKADIDALLLDYGNIIHAMKEKIVYRNQDKCNNWYGSKCCYYGACYKNDFSKLRKKDRK